MSESKKVKTVINISKVSEFAIGRMLVRGYSQNEPFYSTLFNAKVGNIRNAISYMSREGMTLEMLAKTKLSKKDMNKLVEFPKKRVENYNAKLKSICRDRILSDKQLMLELAKFYNLDTKKIDISFVAKDEDNKNHMSMERYTKVLNQLMNDVAFVKEIKDKTFTKQKPKMQTVFKSIDAKNKKIVKSFKKNNVPKARINTTNSGY